MAIVLLTGNLNTFGNTGQYETDPAGWGFSIGGATSSRSLEQAQNGLYSQKIVGVDDFGAGQLIISAGKYTGTNGKKYLARVYVRVPSGNPIASANCEFTFENLIIPFLDSETVRTVTQANDTWVEVEARWTHGIIPAAGEIFLKIDQVDPGNSISPGGVVYIDNLRIYEYEETEDEPAPPVEFTNVWWSKNPVTLSQTAPGGWDAQTNFRMYDDVRVEEVADSDTYLSQLKIHLTPYTNGQVTFQVRQAFRKVLTATPPINATDITRLTDRIKRFKHYTGNVNETNETPGTLTASDVNLVLLGGLSKYKHAELDFFNTFLPAQKKFLTWAPVVKPVDSLQQDYLNFFVYDETTTQVKLIVKCYFDDGTDATYNPKSLTVSYGYLLQIPAGPLNLAVATLNPAKRVLKYEVSLTDQADSLISEVRTYVIDLFSHPRRRFIMWLNSLGAYEVMRFTGMADTQIDVAREEIVKFLPVTYTQQDGERQSNYATTRKSVSYSTGYFKEKYAAEWLEYMEDLLVSPRVFEIIGTRLNPIVITGGAYPGLSDQDYERSIRFRASNSFQDEVFTPITA